MASKRFASDQYFEMETEVECEPNLYKSKLPQRITFAFAPLVVLCFTITIIGSNSFCKLDLMLCALIVMGDAHNDKFNAFIDL